MTSQKKAVTAVETDKQANQSASGANLNLIILLYWRKLSLRAMAVYAALETLADEAGVCEAYQVEISALAGMAESTCRRALRELERHSLIMTQHIYDRQTGRTKNRYFLTGVTGHQTGQTDSSRPHPPVTMATAYLLQRLGQPVSMLTDMMIMHDDVYHDDHDDHESKKTRLTNAQEQISVLLSFLDKGEREKRSQQAHMTLEFAQAWRDWWDRGDFGSLTNPAGFANQEIRHGNRPPSPMTLSEGNLNLGSMGSADATLYSEVLRVVKALPGNGKETIRACRKDRIIERVIVQAREAGDLARWKAAGWLRKEIVEMLARQVTDQVKPTRLYQGR